MGRSKVVALAVLVTATAGCSYPRFAPPARLAAGTMPEPVAAGTGTARVTGNFCSYLPMGGELRGEYGVNDRLTVDLGLTTVMPDQLTSLLGSGGLRFHPIDHEWLRVALSLAFGTGAGGGGLGEDWDEQFALSTVLGFDLGVRFSEAFGLYLANRYQLSTAQGAPTSHWGLHLIGAQLDVAPFFFGLEAGVIYVVRRGSLGEESGLLGPFPLFGLTVGVRFDILSTDGTPEPVPDVLLAADRGR